MPNPSKIALGLGSNVGDRLANIRAAVRMIVEIGVGNMSVSSVYETPPWGNDEQGSFLNACIVLEAAFEPFVFLRKLKAIEKTIGRVPRERWGPREIDADILLWGDLCLQTPTLSIPHPFMHKRAFVLVPLAQIAPDMRHPLLKMTVCELLSGLAEEDEKDIKEIIKVGMI